MERADEILVTLTDRRQLEAKLVAAGPLSNIAMLKVAAQDLTSLSLGDSKT